MLVLQQIIENLLLLSFMGIAFFFVQRHRGSLGTFNADLLNGICLGLTAALVTTVPVTLGDGATVDARAGPVILAGVIAGPIGGLLAALMGGVARGFVGGSFAFSGIAVYGVYALIGVAIRYFRIVDNHVPSQAPLDRCCCTRISCWRQRDVLPDQPNIARDSLGAERFAVDSRRKHTVGDLRGNRTWFGNCFSPEVSRHR